MNYAHLKGRVQAALNRLGRVADIYDRSEGNLDGFNNPTDSYTDSGNTVRCVRTYPNRNTEVSGVEGDLHRDNPLFLFPKGEAPDQEARIDYPEDAATTDNATASTMYEMKAPTRYDTHVEMFGQQVVNS